MNSQTTDTSMAMADLVEVDEETVFELEDVNDDEFNVLICSSFY